MKLTLLSLSILAARARQQLTDLTYDVDEDTLYWPDSTGFELTSRGGSSELGFWAAQGAFCAPEHGGTHLDAPYHFREDGHTAEQIPLERLYADALVVDLVSFVEDGAFDISREMLDAWQAENPELSAENKFVLLYTGWGRYWPNAEQYFGTPITGPDAYPHITFPGLVASGSEWLVEHNIAAVGLDTAAIDRQPATDYMAHRVLFSQQIPGFENVALTPEKATLIASTPTKVAALPMKLRGGTGAPTRIMAISTMPCAADGQWAETRAGEVANVPCTGGAGTQTRLCDSSGNWAAEDTSACSTDNDDNDGSDSAAFQASAFTASCVVAAGVAAFQL